jgi:hypothetical protein
VIWIVYATVENDDAGWLIRAVAPWGQTIKKS